MPFRCKAYLGLVYPEHDLLRFIRDSHTEWTDRNKVLASIKYIGNKGMNIKGIKSVFGDREINLKKKYQNGDLQI